MKRNRFILATIPLIVVGILAFVKLCPRTVPLNECSPIYTKYMEIPGIKATYFKDYPINDSVVVNTTIIEAIDTSQWEQLKREVFPKLGSQKDNTGNTDGKKILVTKKNRKDYNQPIDKQNPFNNDVVFYCSNVPYTLLAFHIESEEQADAVYDKQFEFINNH
jgi:hypothetical protein